MVNLMELSKRTSKSPEKGRVHLVHDRHVPKFVIINVNLGQELEESARSGRARMTRRKSVTGGEGNQWYARE